MERVGGGENGVEVKVKVKVEVEVEVEVRSRCAEGGDMCSQARVFPASGAAGEVKAGVKVSLEALLPGKCLAGQCAADPAA